MAILASASTTEEVGLRDLQAQLSYAGLNGALGVVLLPDLAGEGDAPPCSILPPSTTALLDGTAGEVFRGAYEVIDVEDKRIPTCHPPRVAWPQATPALGPSTIEISDGDVTWTFVIWHLFARATIELISHPVSELDLRAWVRSGERLVLRVMPEDHAKLERGDTHIVARDRADEGQTWFDSWETPERLTQSGAEIAFLIPVIGQEATATMITTTLLLPQIDRCDAPLGCDFGHGLVGVHDIRIMPP